MNDLLSILVWPTLLNTQNVMYESFVNLMGNMADNINISGANNVAIGRRYGRILMIYFGM